MALDAAEQVQRPPMGGRMRPAIIAHSAGNSPAAAAAALEAGADYLEVDLWVHNGRFEARHERTLGPFPVLFEKWYLRRAPSGRFSLGALLREAAGRAELFFDFKNHDRRAARLLGDALAEAGPDVRPAASSQLWHVLRALRQHAPNVQLYYSVDVRAQLNLLFSVADRDLHPAGVSCRHTLLTRDIIDRLHDRGLNVVAWTVDDLARAKELAAWGVDAITTHRVSEFRRELAPA